VLLGNRNDHLYQAVLDDWRIGVVIVEKSEHSIFLNNTMRHIFEQRDGINSSPAGLAIWRPEEDAELQRLLECWRAGFFQRETIRQGLAVTRPSGKIPFSVVFRMLPAMASSSEKIMICVCDPCRPVHDGIETVAAIYCLSHAEAKLAIALVETGTLQEAATHCNITTGSARQYIKRIFHKTHTRGQVELVTLLLRSFPI